MLGRSGIGSTEEKLMCMLARARASQLHLALVTELHPSFLVPPPRPAQLNTVQTAKEFVVHMAKAEEPVKVTADQLGVKEGCGTCAAVIAVPSIVLALPRPRRVLHDLVSFSP